MPSTLLELSEQEQQAFRAICDAACRHSGLQLSPAAVSLVIKLEKAIQQVGQSVEKKGNGESLPMNHSIRRELNDKSYVQD